MRGIGHNERVAVKVSHATIRRMEGPPMCYLLSFSIVYFGVQHEPARI